MRWPYPQRLVIDPAVCLGKSCGKCAEICPYGAIDLDMKERTFEIPVGAMAVATGWLPYDAKRIDTLGFGTGKNIITNAMMERLAAPSGVTGGKIQRPSTASPQAGALRAVRRLPRPPATCRTAPRSAAWPR